MNKNRFYAVVTVILTLLMLTSIIPPVLAEQMSDEAASIDIIQLQNQEYVNVNTLSSDLNPIPNIEPNPISIYGTIKYTDRTADGSQITGLLALPHVTVEIWQEIPGFGQFQKIITHTDLTGFFGVNIIPDTLGPDGLYGGIYFVVVRSESENGCKIRDGPLDSSYTFISPNTGWVNSGTIKEISFAPLDEPYWNILANIEYERDWFAENTKIAYPPGGFKRGKVDVDYPPVDNPFIGEENSGYQPVFDNIQIREGSGWDDNHTQHEYGHAIMDAAGDMILGDTQGTHYTTEEISGRHALCEGWADFIMCAIDKNANDRIDGWFLLPDGTLRADNLEINQWQLSEDQSQGPSGTGDINDDFDGAIIEGCISSILWDIIDDSSYIDNYSLNPSGIFYQLSDNADMLSGQMNHQKGLLNAYGESMHLSLNTIFDVLFEYKVWVQYNIDFGDWLMPRDIHDFWDGWFSSVGNTAAQRNTPENYHWMKAIYFNHGVKVDSKGYPETAPALTDFQITSANPQIGPWFSYKMKITDQAEDQNFLRVRLEYLNTAGTWVPFHTIDVNAMSVVGGFYMDQVLITDLGGESRNVHAVVDDDMLETTSQIIQVVVDTIKPTSAVTASGPYWRNTSPITITATASDTASGVKDVSLWYRYRATTTSAWGSWTLYGTDTAAPWDWSFPWPNGQGHYQFYSIATDNAGNIETAKTSGEAGYGYAPPLFGNIRINNNNAQTLSPNVNIDLSAITGVDLSLGMMRFANDLNYDWGTNYWTIQSVHPVGPGYTRSVELSGGPDTTQMKVHFEKIEIKNNVDFIYIKNSQGNILASFTGSYPAGVEWASSTADEGVTCHERLLNREKSYILG